MNRRLKKERKGLSSENQEIELEEIFLDKLLKERKEEMEMWERKLEVPLRQFNFLALLLLGLSVMASLLFITFKLQISENSKYEALAEQNKFLTSYFSSSRGIIYDRNLTALIKNEASFDCWVNKSELPAGEIELKQTFSSVGAILSQEEMALENIIKTIPNSETEAIVKKNLTYQELILLESKKDEIPGFEVKKRILRKYEAESGLGNILGYLGKISPEEKDITDNYLLDDYLGKEGLEKFYEGTLKEKKGETLIERTAQGKKISEKILKYPQSGNGIVLTIDLELQKKALESLKGILTEVGSEKGTLVALNPKNGEILAAISWPPLDNNLFSKGISAQELKEMNENPLNPQLNRLIAGLYPTGSAIKPFIAAAALEEKIISETTQLYCPLNLCLENKYSKTKECFNDWTFHGWSDVKRALAESINPFFYLVAGGYVAPDPSLDFYEPLLPRYFEGLGKEKIEQYLKSFGFGEKTNVDLPGEAEGRVPTPAWKKAYFQSALQQIWYQGDTYNLSIGQGYLLATPLQLASAFGALANNGKTTKPHFIQKVIDADGNVIKEFQPEIIRDALVSEKNLEIVKQGMRQAVSSPAGSAYSLNFLPVKVAAKTGTAQTPKKDFYENWIAVLAPYENPEIVLMVLIEDVQGMKVAAQKVAREVLQWYFTKEKTIVEKEDELTANFLNTASSSATSSLATSSPDFQQGL